MYVCMYVYMYVRTYVSMYVCMYVYICVCMCVCVYVCMRVCVYACMRVCVYACMRVCMYACMSEGNIIHMPATLIPICFSVIATLASVGVTSVPGPATVTMLLVLETIGLPTDDIHLILSIEWFM